MGSEFKKSVNVTLHGIPFGDFFAKYITGADFHFRDS
jgi:hypothetical protein